MRAEPTREGQQQDSTTSSAGARERAGRARERDLSCSCGGLCLGEERATHALDERKRKKKSTLAGGTSTRHGKRRKGLSWSFRFFISNCLESVFPEDLRTE